MKGSLHIYTTHLQYESVHIKSCLIFFVQPCLMLKIHYITVIVTDFCLFYKFLSVILNTWNKNEHKINKKCIYLTNRV